MDLSYIINRLGEENQQYFGAVAPPIMQTSNFCYKNVSELRKAITNEKKSLIYTRGNNPTTEILCKKLAAMEGAEEALILASGMAAISTAVLSSVKMGDHVICVQKPYSWSFHLLSELLPRFSVETTFIDGTSIKQFKKALKPNTKMVFLESPNTMTFELQDIKAVAEFAKKNKLISIIDNSYSTPLYQQPIKMGIDIVVHSATKYIGGHSDVVAGVICSSLKIIEKIFKEEFLTLGGIIAPFNAWLLLRGLRTMPVRMERISASTLEIVRFLEKHPKVEKVIYPFSTSNPQKELAKKQMIRGNGLVSILLKTTDMKKIEAFCNHLKYFHIAVSWGGYESLVFPVCSYMKKEDKSGIPFNLVRLSIGLEEPEVLIADLDHALKNV